MLQDPTESIRGSRWGRSNAQTDLRGLDSRVDVTGGILAAHKDGHRLHLAAMPATGCFEGKDVAECLGDRVPPKSPPHLQKRALFLPLRAGSICAQCFSAIIHNDTVEMKRRSDVSQRRVSSPSSSRRSSHGPSFSSVNPTLVVEPVVVAECGRQDHVERAGAMQLRGFDGFRSA